jgi:hypothetical protein
MDNGFELGFCKRPCVSPMFKGTKTNNEGLKMHSGHFIVHTITFSQID